MLNKTLLLAAGSLAFAVPAQAHDAWFLPSLTVLSDTNQGITVDAATSSVPFVANHAPLNVDAVQVQAPDGTTGKIENVARGRYRSTFDVVIDKPGTWRIGTTMDAVMGRFKVNGEDWMVGRRRGPGGPGGPGAGGPAAGGPGMGAESGNRPPMPSAGGPGGPGGRGRGRRPRRMIDPAHIVASVADIPAGATDLDLTQNQSRNEFFVTAGEPTQTVLQATGKGLEMVPVTHPTISSPPSRASSASWSMASRRPVSRWNSCPMPSVSRWRSCPGADDRGGRGGHHQVAGRGLLLGERQPDRRQAHRAARDKRRLTYTATLEVVAP
jgi:hypothetical protein